MVDTPPRSAIEALRYLGYVGKLTGFVTVLGTLPSVDPKIGVVIFGGASLLKGTVNRIGDPLEDGKVNQSFRA